MKTMEGLQILVLIVVANCLVFGQLIVTKCKAGLVSYHKTDRADGLCSDLVMPYHVYNCQEYVAQTSDGFLIGIQRMWRPEMVHNTHNPLSPVLLFHGIFTGGDVWVINPPGEGLGFILADHGYDVWILNYRATRFSYGHLNYTSKDKGFWDWSLDEIASEDFCASLQVVSSETQQKVLLVAYSEGAQATLATFSQGKLVELVSKVALLAPVSYITSGPQIVYISSKLQLQKVLEALHIHRLTTRGPLGRSVVDFLCKASSVKCYRDWFRLFSGFTCCINTTRRSYIDKYETQSTSVKNLAHFAQQIRQGTFAMFDYGMHGNILRYKQATSPIYNMSQYPSNHLPTLMVSGEKDAFANTVDVAHLLRDIPPSPHLHTSIVPNFGHLDFVFGYSAHTFVYNSILTFFQQTNGL